jgi:hypothetical protein
MAEFFQEVESSHVLVTDLLEVGTYNSMQKGDLIVVNNATKSVRFPNGSQGQILTTDTGTSTNLTWTNVNDALNSAVSGTLGDILYNNGTTFVSRAIGASGSLLVSSGTAPVWQTLGSALGFTASGQIITSGPGGVPIIEGPGLPGQVLEISASGIARWSTTAAENDTNTITVWPGQINSRTTKNTVANLTWKQTQYSSFTTAKVNFWAVINNVGASASIEFSKRFGSGAQTILTPLTVNAAGIYSTTLSTMPGNDALYDVNVQQLSAGAQGGVSIFGINLDLKYL